jgi:hypothetical protein
MVYGVFGGCYSDWYIVGYFDNRLDADKYCAAFGSGEYYVEEMKDLKDKEDLSKITLKYKHEVVFDLKDGQWVMRDEPGRYECYIADDLRPNFIKSSDTRYSFSWLNFNVNIEKDDRKLAEKIAQDYLSELLAYGDKKVYNKNVKLMNDKFLEPFKVKTELRKQEELRQKELAELARLKAKYEQ